MKTKWTTIAFLIMLLISQRVSAQNHNFSGDWVLNLQKSDFGNAPVFVMPTKLNVIQKPDSVYFVSSGTDTNGYPYSSSARYSLDGNDVKRNYENQLIISNLTLSIDKTKLIKTQKYVMTETPVEPVRIIYETWSLSSDKLLLIREHTTKMLTKDAYIIRAVYERQ